MSLVLGIDPGLDGALALYDPQGGLIDMQDMPTVQHRLTTKRIKRSIDAPELARLIDAWSAEISLVMIERVGVRPGEGAGGAFAFGEGYGLVKGICHAHFIRLETVAPRTWKAAMKVKGDKDESRIRASELLPRSVGHWPLKKHDGRAEAALIALYGANILQKEAA